MSADAGEERDVERVAEAIFLAEGRVKDVSWENADKYLALMPNWGGGKQPRVRRPVRA